MKQERSRGTTRREFITQLFILSFLPVFPELLSGPKQEKKEDVLLDFQEVRDFAIKISQAYHRMRPDNEPVTQEVLEGLVRVVVPYFENEWGNKIPRFPERVEFMDFESAYFAMHVFGLSDCQERVIVNGNFKNPASPFYRSEVFYGVAAHELTHIQQGELCESAISNQSIEVAAQCSMIEVLSAMAIDGNRHAFHALLYELREIAMGTLRLLNYGDTGNPVADEERNRIYWQTVRRVYPDIFEQADLEMNQKHGEFTEDLYWVLMMYAHEPLRKIMGALESSDLTAHDLLLPNDTKAIVFDDLEKIMSNLIGFASRVRWEEEKE